MDMGKVNSMDFREFVDVFGNVIERCPLTAAAVWSQRPFSDWEDLERHFSAFIDALPQSGQEGVLRCYPDLAGRDLHRGALTAESQREHSVAGLLSLGAAEGLRLAELNSQYCARFGFPFVLAARLSDRGAVFRELERRLHRPSALELRTALGEVKKICRLRLADLFGVDPAARPQRPCAPGPWTRGDRDPAPCALGGGAGTVRKLTQRRGGLRQSYE
ncbi:putative 2-oxo-4-hydroxy-4-carboxy-5-ureidoimidazoline decarboxylase [Artibeus jamaicensis]|uniref:putative 2-oxo-4-hydroxy-4-carboxy-5-ureidoimidazoline decarboxylase n=1 Tax=Artibeus jamaicensis TaxID=9417 RepID=UPI00235A8025|nr:putative 2-oxo-4-hydroxy-4-carboxy-5-ureidoimidazoline decarboxylase [Artibeus jamaicensis]